MKERIKALQKENEILTERNINLSNEIESLKNSASFRIGRKVTLIPRKIRDQRNHFDD